MAKLPHIPVSIRTIPAIVLLVISLFALYAGLVAGSGEIPVNDKVQHVVCFLCIGLALYWVPEISKKRATQLTAVLLTSASILSEMLQAYMTVRIFDPVDILANLAGSGIALGMSTAYHTRMLRRRRDAKYSTLTQNTEMEDLEAGTSSTGAPPSADEHTHTDDSPDIIDTKEAANVPAVDLKLDRGA